MTFIEKEIRQYRFTSKAREQSNQGMHRNKSEERGSRKRNYALELPCSSRKSRRLSSNRIPLFVTSESTRSFSQVRANTRSHSIDLLNTFTDDGIVIRNEEQDVTNNIHENFIEVICAYGISCKFKTNSSAQLEKVFLVDA